MLKNFLKTNVISSLLIIFSFFIILNNFFRFFQNKTSHQFVPWLSNYQGGFVRRGLPGEFFFQLHELSSIHLGWITFIFVCILYFLFYLIFFNLIKKIKLNILFIFAIFSPISFYFPILNSKATGHKDIIFLLFLSLFCYLIPKIKKKHANYTMILLIILVVLSHDGLIFFIPYLIIPFLTFYRFKNFREALINLLPTSIISIVLMILIYNFKGTEQHVIEICNSIKSYAHSECENIGQISTLKYVLTDNIMQKSKLVYGGLSVYPAYFKIYITGFIIGFMPLIILYNKSKFQSSIPGIKINSLLFLFFPLIASFPIYYIAADWGRYLHISYISSLVLIIFFLQNNIFDMKKIKLSTKSFISKIIFLFIFIIYSFGWTVPVCCERSFKPGIGKVIERIILYYKK